MYPSYLSTCSQLSNLEICNQIHYFNQTTDHFNHNNKNTFKQKYIYYEPENCCQNDGLLLYTGNQGSIDFFCQHYDFQINLAKKHGWGVLYIEHRYYGESIVDEKYDYLSIDQVLADYVNILREGL